MVYLFLGIVLILVIVFFVGRWSKEGPKCYELTNLDENQSISAYEENDYGGENRKSVLIKLAPGIEWINPEKKTYIAQCQEANKKLEQEINEKLKKN